MESRLRLPPFAVNLICIFCKLISHRVRAPRFGGLCALSVLSAGGNGRTCGSSDALFTDSCAYKSRNSAGAGEQKPCGAYGESNELCAGSVACLNSGPRSRTEFRKRKATCSQTQVGKSHGLGDSIPQLFRRHDLRTNIWRCSMLWTIFIVLMILWLLGMVSSYTLGGFIHILLILALATVLIRIIQGRNPL